MKRYETAPFKTWRALPLAALALFLALGLTACEDAGEEPAPEPSPKPPQPSPPPPTQPAPSPAPPTNLCPPDCVLTITLPEDPNAPPEASPPEFWVNPGAEVTINLVDESGRPDQAATVLRFMSEDDTPFVVHDGPNEQPVTTVSLNRGKNSATVRSNPNGKCSPQNCCKYDVVNTGNKDREVLDPEVIIWSLE